MDDLKDQENEPVENQSETPAPADAIAKELLPISLEAEMKRSYLDYAMSVIVGRALPDVRDGLKPVHRRVLYAMREIKNTHNNPFKKAARVVGEVLGKFHPHGDSAAYMTIVRMAQPFSLRYPLVEGQGNFGSIDGDSPAAMRYTEVRLEKIASTMLQDIHEETVDFVPNFDNSEVEPVVLSTRLPQLLVNGSSGIAVGMATNIPPHNLKESIDACLYVLHHPACSVDEIIPLIPAPDFPTGGIIFGIHEVHEGYRTGRGRVVMRARTHTEEWGSRGDRVRIVVDEIPYMVNKRSLYERMHELWRDKKLEGIAEMRDRSAEDIRICIDLKQGVLPEVVLNNLFKYTQMQESFGMNMVALVDGQPKLLTLKEMIVHFLEHRREIVMRRTEFRLRKARDAGHILEGQAVALSNLDDFLRIIRAAKTPEEAATQLLQCEWPAQFAQDLLTRIGENAMKRYPENMDMTRGMTAQGLYRLTRTQVDNILAMNLRRLTGLEQDKIRSDYLAVMDEIFDLLDILFNPERVNTIIAQELTEIRREYGDERRSTIDLLGDPNFDKRDLIPRRDMVVTLSRDGYIKTQELDDYTVQIRGGRGRKVQEMTRDDRISELFIANTHDIVLIFTNKARVYALDVFDLPEGKSNARGRPLVNLLPFEEGEQVQVILPIKDYSEDHYVLLATNQGTVKKTQLSAYRNARTKGVIATILNEGESLIGAAVTDGQADVMLFTDSCRSVRFNRSEIRVMGRSSHGVGGARLRRGQSVIAMLIVDDPAKTVLLACEHGYGKRTKVEEFPVHHRNVSGVIAIADSERNGKLVSAVLVDDGEDIMMLSVGGNLIRMNANEIPVYGRATQGVRLIKLVDDTLASVRRAPRAEAVERIVQETRQTLDQDRSADAQARTITRSTSHKEE